LSGFVDNCALAVVATATQKSVCKSLFIIGIGYVFDNFACKITEKAEMPFLFLSHILCVFV